MIEIHVGDRLVCVASHTETMRSLGIVRTAAGGLRAVSILDLPSGFPVDREAAPVPSHRHYKGGIYAVLGKADYEGEADLVVYRGVDGRGWARPTDMFEGNLPDGRIRFAPLSA